MLVFGLKKTKLWFTTALLLLLSSSICPCSCYPHTEEDENPLGPEDNLENLDDRESVRDNDDQDWEEEEDLMEESGDDVEDDPTDKPKRCFQDGEMCKPITATSEKKTNNCCGKPDLVCRKSRITLFSRCLPPK